MAADAILSVKAQGNVQGFTALLTSTACEWLLIFLLLVNAALSYLSTKFARCCQLQLPCIFCSRLDHVLGNEKPKFCRNLLCSTHRSEILSLVSCNFHDKLVNGHDMCDDWLFSFSTKSYSNPEMRRLFISKLGFDVISCGPQSSFRNSDFVPVFMSKRLCSCCNKPQRSRQNMQRLPVPRVSKSNIPAVPPRRVGKSTSDSLSRVEYGEQKFSSDSESEFPFSDDGGGGRSIIRDINLAKDDSSKSNAKKYSTPYVSSWQELGKLNWPQPGQNTHPSPLPSFHSMILLRYQTLWKFPWEYHQSLRASMPLHRLSFYLYLI